MSNACFDYHDCLSGASFQEGQFPFPFLHVPPPFDIPWNVREVLSGNGCYFTAELIRIALEEDGPDLTSLGIFSPEEMSSAYIVAKQDSIVVGLPFFSLILSMTGFPEDAWKAEVEEGAVVSSGTVIARMHGRTIQLLKAERILLNILTHLSGVGNVTREYASRLEGTGVRLLDTRKTLPGFRHLEKYAVRVAGGVNHRMDLAEMLMIKDNHIDAAGGITQAVEALRRCYHPCPPIEIECRNRTEVQEAVLCRPERILLDNMDRSLLAEVLPLIPREIEAEISGGVTLGTIRDLALSSAERPADYISVGRITHSAPSADFSMRIERCC